MDAQLLAGIAGVILSWLFLYVPGLNVQFDRLSEEVKQLIMLILVILVAGIAFGLACAGWGADFGLSLTCDRPGFSGLLRSLFEAIVINQGIHRISPKPKALLLDRSLRGAA